MIRNVDRFFVFQVRAIDAFNPNDLAIPIMIRGGITTAQVLPGSANVMVSLVNQLDIVCLRITRV